MEGREAGGGRGGREAGGRDAGRGEGSRMGREAEGAGKQGSFCSPNSQEFQVEEQDKNKDAEGKEGEDNLLSTV